MLPRLKFARARAVETKQNMSPVEQHQLTEMAEALYRAWQQKCHGCQDQIADLVVTRLDERRQKIATPLWQEQRTRQDDLVARMNQVLHAVGQQPPPPVQVRQDGTRENRRPMSTLLQFLIPLFAVLMGSGISWWMQRDARADNLRERDRTEINRIAQDLAAMKAAAKPK